jgi:hypothetical protein
LKRYWRCNGGGERRRVGGLSGIGFRCWDSH